jgi:cell division protein FtsB
MESATLQAGELGTLVIGLVVLIGFVSYFVKVAWSLSKVLAELNIILAQLRSDFKQQETDIRELKANDHAQALQIKDNTTKLEWLLKE